MDREKHIYISPSPPVTSSYYQAVTSELEKQKYRKLRTQTTPPRLGTPPLVHSGPHALSGSSMPCLGQLSGDMVQLEGEVESSSSSDSDSSSEDEDEEGGEGEGGDAQTDNNDGIVFCDEDEVAIDNVIFDEEDEDTAVFTGYSGPAGEALHQVPSPSSLRSLVGEGSFHCYRMRQESSDNMDELTGDKEHDELSEKLKNTIEVRGAAIGADVDSVIYISPW